MVTVTVTASAADKSSPDDGDITSETPISFGFKCVTSTVRESFSASSSSANVVYAVIEYVVPTSDMSAGVEKVCCTVSVDATEPV